MKNLPFNNQRGLSLLEGVIATSILAATVYLASVTIRSTSAVYKNIKTQEAIQQIEDELKNKMLKSAASFILTAATDVSNSCQLTVARPFSLSESQLTGGLNIVLLKKSSVSADYDLVDFYNDYPTDASDPPYSAAINRCLNAATIYPTQNTGGLISNFSAEKGFYFCASVVPTQGGGEATSINSMQPILAEFLFVPYDIKMGRALLCNELTAGWPSSAVGQLYYSIYWKRVDSGGKKYSRSISGFHVLADPTL